MQKNQNHTIHRNHKTTYKTLSKTALKSLPKPPQNTDTQKEPTLKQLFSKENLTTYTEATRHKPLFEA